MYFAEYVGKIRLHYAENELKNTSHSITEVAMHCGFSNVQALNKVFREKGCVRHVHQDHESAYSNGRRSTLPDRYVFELAEVRENGKGYGKAHHSGTEKKSYPVNTGDTRV